MNTIKTAYGTFDIYSRTLNRPVRFSQDQLALLAELIERQLQGLNPCVSITRLNDQGVTYTDSSRKVLNNETQALWKQIFPDKKRSNTSKIQPSPSPSPVASLHSSNNLKLEDVSCSNLECNTPLTKNNPQSLEAWKKTYEARLALFNKFLIQALRYLRHSLHSLKTKYTIDLSGFWRHFGWQMIFASCIFML